MSKPEMPLNQGAQKVNPLVAVIDFAINVGVFKGIASTVTFSHNIPIAMNNTNSNDITISLQHSQIQKVSRLRQRKS